MYSPIVNKVSNTGGLGRDLEFMDRTSTLTWINPPCINKGASIVSGFWSVPIQKSSLVLSPEKFITFFGIIFALNDSFGEYALKDKIDSPFSGFTISIKYSIFETTLSSSWFIVEISNPISDSLPCKTSGVVWTLTL